VSHLQSILFRALAAHNSIQGASFSKSRRYRFDIAFVPETLVGHRQSIVFRALAAHDGVQGAFVQHRAH